MKLSRVPKRPRHSWGRSPLCFVSRAPVIFQISPFSYVIREEILLQGSVVASDLVLANEKFG